MLTCKAVLGTLSSETALCLRDWRLVVSLSGEKTLSSDMLRVPPSSRDWDCLFLNLKRIGGTFKQGKTACFSILTEINGTFKGTYIRAFI